MGFSWAMLVSGRVLPSLKKNMKTNGGFHPFSMDSEGRQFPIKSWKNTPILKNCVEAQWGRMMYVSLDDVCLEEIFSGLLPFTFFWGGKTVETWMVSLEMIHHWIQYCPPF